MGLSLYKGEFQYGRVYDGDLRDVVLSFTKEEDFVDWLAAQSDDSLSGNDEKDFFYKDNQRITRARLFDFLSTKPGPR